MRFMYLAKGFVSAAAFAAVCAGCGGGTSTPKGAKDADASVTKALSQTAFTKDLKPSAHTCTPASSTEAQAPDNPKDFWDVCQSLYACSPTAQAELDQLFSHGDVFELGFTDLEGVKSEHFKHHMGGFYAPGTDKIVLDRYLKPPLLLCPLLLHELVHRFDPRAQSGEESLRVEFKAYWYQYAFTDEWRLQHPETGQISYATRQGLAESIVKLYGFSASEEEEKEVASEYPQLPQEKYYEKLMNSDAKPE